MMPSCRLLLLLFVLVAVCETQARKKLLDALRTRQQLCFPDALPCVLLMNEKGSIGCAQCLEQSLSAPVLEFDSDNEFLTFLQSSEQDKRVLLVADNLFFKSEGLLKGLVNFRDNVQAVVVYEKRAFETPSNGTEPFPYPPSAGFSGDKSFPNRVYDNLEAFRRTAPQNAKGTGFQHVSFPFNMFYIGANDARRIRDQMKRFSEQNKTATSPQFSLVSNGKMDSCPEVNLTAESKQTQMEEDLKNTNAAACLEAGTCRPVGGFSVWSSLAYLEKNRSQVTANPSESNASGPSASEPLPVVAVTAPLDSTAMFHALAYGSAAEIASVASLMAIVKSVGDYSRSKDRAGRKMLRYPMYFAFNAQSWGFTGSGRFLVDVQNVTCKNANVPEGLCKDPYLQSMKFKALNGADFQVINLGGLVDPTGAPPTSANFSFFLHGNSERQGSGSVESALRSSFGRTRSGTNELILRNGFRKAPAADASRSFHSYSNQSDITTLTNYETNYTNKFYHSPYDNASFIHNVTREPLYAATRAVAQAVIDLSFGDNQYIVPEEGELIDGMIDCLTTNWVDKNCTLAEDFLGMDYVNKYQDVYKNVLRSNYAGIFVPLGHLAGNNPSGFGKISFLQRFMAFHNRILPFSEKAQRNASLLKCTTNEECESNIDDENTGVKNLEDFRTPFCARNQCVIAESHLHGAFGTGLVDNNPARSSYNVSLAAEPIAVRVSDNKTTPTPSPIPYPAWTESNWKADLEVCYSVEDSTTFGIMILASGIVTFLACLLAVWVFKRSMTKREDEDEDVGGGIPLNSATAT